MKILEVSDRTSTLIEQLLNIWEASVRVTHLFLSGAEVNQIKSYVPQALKGVKHLIVMETENGEPLGFMGVENKRLEMLFHSPAERRKGFGGDIFDSLFFRNRKQ